MSSKSYRFIFKFTASTTVWAGAKIGATKSGMQIDFLEASAHLRVVFCSPPHLQPNSHTHTHTLLSDPINQHRYPAKTCVCVCPNATYSRPRSCMCWPFHLILLPQNKNFSSVTCCCHCRCLCCCYCCGVAITKWQNIHTYILFVFATLFAATVAAWY